VNEDFATKHALQGTVSSVDPHFLLEAKAGTSTWDAYLGITPWVDMERLERWGAIEPWDEYVSPKVLAGVLPQIRAESSLKGHVYSWPFLLDVTVQGWNGELVERAGLDPEHAPRTWDQYIANARTIKETGVAPYGCTFDPSAARSLVPIAHSFASDLYTEDGLFNFMHPATVEALEVMKRMRELSHPDVLDPDAALASVSPDEAAFAAQTVAYYVKYQNAHVRFANAWFDPARLHLAALPANGGPGGTIFWTTGLALMRHGKHKREAGAYVKELTRDNERIWRRSLGTDRNAAGQLPAFDSLWPWSDEPKPPWSSRWVTDVRSAFQTASAIRPHPLGLTQFKVSQSKWEAYLRGSERNARLALKGAMDAARKAQQRQQRDERVPSA
jgi:ABC-type glycerol-3-phosphate transport system substrate-binding protein